MADRDPSTGSGSARAASRDDRDLASVQEARTLARRAREAAPILAELTQEQIDALVDAMAAAITPQAEALARLAHEETGYGVVADKVQKNLFASENVYRFIKPIKTVGVIRRLEDRKVIEIAEPFGVVCAIVPSTNPTSTAIYKILIAIKARCPIVLSPHPAAVRCITRVAEIMQEAARKAGAPEGAISWMTTVTLEGTQELMKARETAVILATGGMGLVRAAYSAGKPAYGVGPGNAPAYIESSADIAKAVRDIVTGKTFDNGVLCSSENSVVVDAPLVEEVKRAFTANGGYFMSSSEIDAVGRILVSPQRLPNPALVGRPATYIAQQAGIQVPPGTRVLLAELAGVGRDFPLSIEKLCPVLSFYVVKDWREGCERCKQILRYGGMGHTMSIHSRNDDIILQFGLKKPAYRIVVNSPTTHGSIGLTTGLDPAMTLGCGGYGGNITSDNIIAAAFIEHQAARLRDHASRGQARGGTCRGQRRAAPEGPGDGGARRACGRVAGAADRPVSGVPRLLGAAGRPASPALPATAAAPPPPPAPPLGPLAAHTDKPVDFVCEDDVKQAVRQGRKIVIGERSIVTPAARDLGEQHHVFTQAAWPC